MAPRTKKPVPTPEEIAKSQADADLRAVDKMNMQEVLTKHICSVTFKKVDGSERTMRCTLRKDLLPPEPEKDENGEVKREFLTTVPVFDLEKNAWRSFRVDNIISCDIVE